MAKTGRRSSALAAELVAYPQVLVNVRVRERKRPDDGAGRSRR